MNRHDTLFRYDVQTFRCEGHAEHDGRRFGRDIGKAADAGVSTFTAMGIDIAHAVHLQGAHEADIQPSVVIQVKLVRHVIDGRGSDHGAKGFPRNRETADAAGFHRECDPVQHAAFSGMAADHLRQADPYVDDVIHPELHRGTSPDDVAHRTVSGSQLGERVDLLAPLVPVGVGNLKASRKSGVRFISLLGLRNHDRIHQAARYDRIPRSRGCIHQAVHLYDHHTVIGFYRLADRQRIPGHKHIVKGNVALPIRRRSLDQRDRKLRKLIIQVFLPVHFHIFYQRFIRGQPVNARPFQTGIHKYIQPDFGESARQSSRLRTDCVGNAAKRQVVSFKPVLQHHFLCTWHRPEVTADQLVHRTLAYIALRIPVLVPHPEAGARNDGQVLRGLHLLVSSKNSFV